MENTFFDKESFDNDIELEVNLDVLHRIYGDGIKPSDALRIEFFFVTDMINKAEIFKVHLQKNFPDYEGLVVRNYKDAFEIFRNHKSYKNVVIISKRMEYNNVEFRISV